MVHRPPWTAGIFCFPEREKPGCRLQLGTQLLSQDPVEGSEHSASRAKGQRGTPGTNAEIARVPGLLAAGTGDADGTEATCWGVPGAAGDGGAATGAQGERALMPRLTRPQLLLLTPWTTDDFLSGLSSCPEFLLLSLLA